MPTNTGKTCLAAIVIYKIKMDQKWIHTLLILVFYQTFTSGVEVVTVKEGETHRIECRPSEIGTMIVWFRVLDNLGMEFIASYASNGMPKSKEPQILNPKLRISNDVLTLTSFKKADDSGVYSCASIKSNELKFGEVKRLVGVTDPVVTPKPKAATTEPCPTTTARPCSCNNSRANRPENPALYCPPVILGPLAGACGLLLLLLIVTALYCNKIRTRRCPHHYKKRPQNMAPGKQKMTNSHV